MVFGIHGVATFCTAAGYIGIGAAAWVYASARHLIAQAVALNSDHATGALVLAVTGTVLQLYNAYLKNRNKERDLEFAALKKHSAEQATSIVGLTKSNDEAHAKIAQLETATQTIPAIDVHTAAIEGRMDTIEDLARVGYFKRPGAQYAPPSPTLLLVEDDPAVARALSRFCTQVGYTVDIAATVSEARAKLLKNPFCAILDRKLADGTDGLDILRDIRASKMGTRVAVVTAKEIEPGDKVMDLQPDAYFVKPVDAEELAEFLALGLHRYAPSAAPVQTEKAVVDLHKAVEVERKVQEASVEGTNGTEAKGKPGMGG